jgi:hypothetical protein
MLQDALLGDESAEVTDRNDIPLLLGGKRNFYTCLNGIYLHMQLIDWLLVEVALLLIGLTQIF